VPINKNKQRREKRNYPNLDDTIFNNKIKDSALIRSLPSVGEREGKGQKKKKGGSLL